MMSSMKQNMLPSLCTISYDVALKTYSAFICQLLFMGPKLTASLKQQKKIQYLLKKGELDSNPSHFHSKKETEMGLCNTLLVVCAESGNVVAELDLKSLRKHGKNGYGYQPFQLVVNLNVLIVQLRDFFNLQFPILMEFYRQALSKTKREDSVTKEQTVLSMFWSQVIFETLEFAKELLTKLVSIKTNATNLNPFHQELVLKAKELAKNIENLVEKRASKTPANIEDEFQVTEKVSKQNSTKTFQICDVCREPIKFKKFFDERRFGILEKCICVVCYGCIRKLTGSAEKVVKGPIRCPICFVISDNVASSANWIKDEGKVEFFQKYRKNVQNTCIKMKLGWTSFPKRK